MALLRKLQGEKTTVVGARNTLDRLTTNRSMEDRKMANSNSTVGAAAASEDRPQGGHEVGVALDEPRAFAALQATWEIDAITRAALCKCVDLNQDEVVSEIRVCCVRCCLAPCS
jgi:hypothetical protein